MQKLKGILKGFLLLLFVVVATALHASTEPDSIANDIFEIEKTSSLQRISFEKVRIANDYRSADVRLMTLVDSVTTYILQLKVSAPRRNLYLSRLQLFLKNINRYYSDSYLKNGTYLAVISYYPVMIDWDLKGNMLDNMKQYMGFSIKATRLIPVDSVAEDFLTDYMKDHQDDIFRYADEFDDRPFARRVLEKAVKAAPESAKRYYTTGNSVSNGLRGSNDPYVKKTFEIYNRYGLKSRSYLLVDDILKDKISLTEADSIGMIPDAMFSYLVKNAMRHNAPMNYSMYRYLDNTGVDLMRKLNQEALASNYNFTAFKSKTTEEMFVLLMYGYRETTLRTFQLLLEVLQKKAAGVPLSSSFIHSMNGEDLKQLVIHCDKNQTLNGLLSLVDDERKDYMLALTTMDEKEESMPPFREFTADAANNATDQGYRTMTDVPKARPPKIVENDNAEEPIKPAVKPESVAGDKPVAETVVKSSAPDEVKQVVTAPEGKELSVAKLAEPLAETSEPDEVPIPLPEVIDPININLDSTAKAILLLKKNILKTLQNIPAFIDQKYAEEILLYAAEREPDEVFKKVETFMRRPYSMKVLERCAYHAPASVKRYLYNPSHPVNYILQQSKDPVVKKIFEVNPQLGYQSKPLLLLDDIISGRLTTKDAVTISAMPTLLYSNVVKILSKGKYVGDYSIDHEMRDYSLRFVREINDKIAVGAAQPFYSVEAFTAPELYFLMLYGREEVFTSTFNGLFNRFMMKLPADDGNAFLLSINKSQFRDFLSLCSNYGVLDEFLAKFKTTDRQQLLTSYISNLETERDNLSSVVLVAEAISNLTDAVLLTTMQTTIKSEYERVSKAKDQIGISIYGVLSSIISGNAKTEASWFRRISKQFSVAPVSSLDLNSLFDNTGICIEQMYFYNDDDGRSSFINFMNTYKSNSAWHIEDKYNYVRIYTTEGKRVEILANKPEYEENGVNAINAYLQSKRETPTVIVHRGHSFHTEATLTKVPASAKLVFVGSCGGFYKISIALENAPDAHIISTKQIGTKSVNDAMLLALNESIRQGKNIVWNEFWDKMRERLANNQYFSDYIPPHKNLESTFIRAYYKILGV